MCGYVGGWIMLCFGSAAAPSNAPKPYYRTGPFRVCVYVWVVGDCVPLGTRMAVTAGDHPIPPHGTPKTKHGHQLNTNENANTHAHANTQYTTRNTQHAQTKIHANTHAGETPPIWLEPCQVWEVRGAELTVSPVHKVGRSVGCWVPCYIYVWGRCMY